MNDTGDIRRSEPDYQTDTRQNSGDNSNQGRAGLIANAILIVSLACFIAVEIGYIANVAQLGRIQALFALMLFMCAVLIVYLIARYLPFVLLRLHSKKADIAMVILAFIYTCIMIYIYIIDEQTSAVDFSWFAVAVSSLSSGVLTCIGLLKCYGYLSDMGDESPQYLLYIALVAGLFLFFIAYWLVTPVKLAVFSLFALLGFVVLLMGRKEIRSTQDNRVINQQAALQASEYLNTQPIHLNRYTHFVMFALELTLAYCIGSTMQTWTPLSIASTVVLTVVACVVIRYGTKRKPLALGELGKVALPVCIALLFCVVAGLASVNAIVAPIATALFLLLGTMNAHWLIRTSSLFNLNSTKHISSGKLPLVIGTLSGFALGLVMQRFDYSIIALNSQSQLGLLASGLVAVVLVVTYTLLPFNQGTPVKEGIMQSDFSSPKKPMVDKQARPFKELCLEFGSSHGFTSREQEVFFLLACGYNAETIAQLLFVSGNTVRTHVYRIYQKTDIHSQQELIRKLDNLFRGKQ